MSLDKKQINSTTIVFFRETTTINSENTIEFKKNMMNLLQNSNYCIFLDCENIEFFDSSAISVLISCLKKALTNKGFIKLINLPDQIRHIFEIIKLDKIFDIYDSIESALKNE